MPLSFLGEVKCTYLCGNSLGLLCKRSETLVQEEFRVWASKHVTLIFRLRPLLLTLLPTRVGQLKGTFLTRTVETGYQSLIMLIRYLPTF